LNLQFEPDFTEQSAWLSREESHHVSTVLRKKTGDEIFVTDGRGKIFRCRLTEVRSNKCTLQVEHTMLQEKSEPTVNLFISVLKTSERMEWLTEKTVELGVEAITFYVSDRTERRNINTSKLSKVAVSAIKQSGRALLPIVSGPIKFQDAINMNYPQKFVASLMKEHGTDLFSAFKKPQQTAILIGPEGDFTPDEMKMALNAGFKPVTLGSFTLRSETAALAALQTLIVAGSR
jgi:16S rRNA (uracil1498-N3)-methyltransferase